jgi:hypothetical protein
MMSMMMMNAYHGCNCECMSPVHPYRYVAVTPNWMIQGLLVGTYCKL